MSEQQLNKHYIEEDPSFAWVENFDLFLFDLDGLLINTDELLFKGFQKAFRQLYGKCKICISECWELQSIMKIYVCVRSI